MLDSFTKSIFCVFSLYSIIGNVHLAEIRVVQDVTTNGTEKPFIRTKLETSAGYVVYRKYQVRDIVDIQFLLLQSARANCRWSPTKGRVKFAKGETEEMTADRELREETGLRKSDIHILPDYTKITQFNVAGMSKHGIYWLAELINPSREIVLSIYHKGYEWAFLEQACELVMFPDLQQLLRDCYAHLQKVYKLN